MKILRIFLLFSSLLLTAANAQELRSATDYYKAANDLFKLGRLGQAFAYYEKADALAPGNRDVEHNMAVTLKQLQQSSANPERHSFWVNRVIPISKRFGAIAYFMLGLSALVFAWCAQRAKSKTRLRDAIKEPSFIAGGFFFVVCAGLATMISIAQQANLGVVVADVGAVRSGPSEKFTELTKLVAGSNFVLTEEKKPGWRQIEFSSGNLGWIEEKSILEL